MSPLSTAELSQELPLWYQVAHHLTQELQTLPSTGSGGGRLPVEEELADRYGVSVVTVRRALRCLQERGWIVRQRRHGTFVAPGVSRPEPLRLHGSVDAVVAQQSADHASVLCRDLVETPEFLLETFPATENLVHTQRMRTHGGGTTSFAENWVLPELAALISDEDLQAMPMTEALRRRTGVTIGHFRNELQAQLAPTEIAEALDMALLTPVMLCNAITYDANGRAVDAARIYYRGDQFTYSVTFDAENEEH